MTRRKASINSLKVNVIENLLNSSIYSLSFNPLRATIARGSYSAILQAGVVLSTQTLNIIDNQQKNIM